MLKFRSCLYINIIALIDSKRVGVKDHTCMDEHIYIYIWKRVINSVLKQIKNRSTKIDYGGWISLHDLQKEANKNKTCCHIYALTHYPMHVPRIIQNNVTDTSTFISYTIKHNFLQIILVLCDGSKSILVT